jgi:hypothetical protein
VIDWLSQTLPAAGETQDAANLRVAQHIAADRLDRYLSEADEAWRLTSEIKYANLALRLLTAASKLPAMPGTLEALAMDAILGPLPNECRVGPAGEASAGPPTPEPELPTARSAFSQSAICNPQFEIPNPKSQIPNPPSPPPLGDCSQPPDDSPARAANTQSDSAPTSHSETPSDDVAQKTNHARTAFLAPAQPLETTDANSFITQLKITPQKLTLNTEKPLNRRQRRRLQRLAKNKNRAGASIPR